ncbi:prion-inhibition and propagation-domain-containing protein [Fusarium solani]|uniref:Prion-inhibition and propagation-domain-containing protein n=1 Tax=Fusarium solani TaxID=169388 RepID=A0A9P9G586_FUSSL|nr:prion-inhibition and propagation-domain-containing protein [Fusarium solani]KAH7231502.1 prion-inhibition and propagation-domain-containing protein [Fusarium solani]
MEAVSLGIALVTIVGTFKDVIELIDLIASAKDTDRDYMILETKIDIEKTLLLDWASGIRLLSPDDYDKRLNDDGTRSLICRVLDTISQLMGDANSLKKQYGMREGTGEDREWLSRPRGARISAQSMVQFADDFENLTTNAPLHQQPHRSFRKRIVWVCQDKKKLESLVKELSHLVASLRNLIPPLTNSATPLITVEDLSDRFDIPNLRLLRDASKGRVAAIASPASEALTEKYKDRVLMQIWFRTMNERRNAVHRAYPQTLCWVFDPPEDGFEWYDLAQWLRSDSGIYWISGKAGSGKSTLMKYLFDEPKTKVLLSHWASDCTLGSFFFWYAGNPEQKSLRGLMRAILHQLLSHPLHRSLIPESLPDMWHHTHAHEDNLQDPSEGDLLYAFEQFAQRKMDGPLAKAKFCFFIDGLDEFSGVIRESIAFVETLVRDPNIKVVVSSRPIPSCHAAFRNLPSLLLQELNRVDIQEYVSSEVAENDGMQRLMEQNPEEAADILEDLVDKSCGVFLWVVLACRSILDGLDAWDTIGQLRERVDELPDELREMFQHMLRKVPGRYAVERGRWLGLCHALKEDGGSSTSGAVQVLSLALAESEEIGESYLQGQCLELQKKRQMCQEIGERIRSRCGGLLELSHDMVHPLYDDADALCFCNGRVIGRKDWKSHDCWIDSKVEFMHRTVFEYLNDQDESEVEHLGRENPSAVYSALSMCELFTAVGLLYSRDPNIPQADAHFIKALHWGAQAQMENPSDKSNVFWRLVPLLDHLRELCPWSLHRECLFQQLLSQQFQGSCPPSHQAYQLAVGFRAINYVREHPDIAWQISSSSCCVAQQPPSMYLVEDDHYMPERLVKLVAFTFTVLHSADVNAAWSSWLNAIEGLPIGTMKAEEHLVVVTRQLLRAKPAVPDWFRIMDTIQNRPSQSNIKEVGAIWRSLEAELDASRAFPCIPETTNGTKQSKRRPSHAKVGRKRTLNTEADGGEDELDPRKRQSKLLHGQWRGNS